MMLLCALLCRGSSPHDFYFSFVRRGFRGFVDYANVLEVEV